MTCVYKEYDVENKNGTEAMITAKNGYWEDFTIVV